VNTPVRSRLGQIINMKHELVQLAGKIDWDWIDRESAPPFGACALRWASLPPTT
jgi:hypothetical protein